ncbi:MAG: metal-sensing transcriptional repressor [Patescibacteria group bacterium]
MSKQSPLISQINRTCGQLEGLARLTKDKRACPEVINQFLAIKAGLNRIGMLILSDEYKNCSLKDRKRMEVLIKNIFKIK